MRILIECDEKISSINIEFAGGSSVITTNPDAAAALQVTNDEPQKTSAAKHKKPQTNNEKLLEIEEDIEDYKQSQDDVIDKPVIDIKDRPAKVAEEQSESF